jgi:excisionase family DNA binding protein
MGQLLTVKDVAQMQRVQPGTVYRWVRLGRLQRCGRRGQVRFERAAVLRALEARK